MSKRRQMEDEMPRERVEGMMGRIPFSEDAMFGLLCTRFPEVPSRLLSLVLRREEISLSGVMAQHRVPNPSGRGAILDVYGRDEALGMDCAIEMQGNGGGMGDRRIAHISGLLSSLCLDRGRPHRERRKAVLMVIYKRPPYRGMPQVALRPWPPYNGSGNLLSLSQTIVAEVNGQIREGPLGEYLDDILSPIGEEKRTRELREARRYFMHTTEGGMRLSKEMRRIMAPYMDDVREAVRKETAQRTTMENMSMIAMRLRETGKLTGEEILELTGIDIGSLG